MDAVLDGGPVFPAGCPENELQVLFHGAVGQKLEVLEHNPQPAAECRDLTWPDLTHVVFQYLGFSVTGGQFSINGFQESRFPTSYFSDDVGELSAAKFKIDIVQNAEFLLVDVYVAVDDEWLFLHLLSVFSSFHYGVHGVRVPDLRCDTLWK